MLDQKEKDIILLLVSSDAPLDKSPKHNWVEDAGGLPPYVRKLARGIMKAGGHDLSSAISIAISRIKVWAAGGSKVNATTRAKAAAALAQWEAAKAKDHAKLSALGETEYIALSNISSFDTSIVNAAWDAQQREARQAWAAAHPEPVSSYANDSPTVGGGYNYSWICELGTDYIVTSQDTDKGKTRYKIPYTVDQDYNVTFGDPTKIIQVWVEDDDDLTDDEYAALSNISSGPAALANIVKVAQSLKK